MAYDGLQVSGDVITFGVQAVEATAAQAKMLLGIRTSNQPDEQGSEAPIQQGTLFKLLGFRSVSSIDFYPAESPTYVTDLNRPLPSELYGRFNLVYDGGTSEHCFCTSEVLSNAVRLTKLGGRVMHHIPLNNWVDHGFYQFSPTLFFDFYEANGFDELNMLFHFIDRRRERYLPYEPRNLGRLPYSFGGTTRVQGFFTARKAKLIDDIVFSIQSRYRRAFSGEKENIHSPETRWSRLARSIGKRTFRLRAKPL
jgi:hypothetical protein